MKIPGLGGTLKIFMLYFSLLLIVGLYKVFLVIPVISKEFQSVASAISYITLPLISILIIVLLGAIFGITWYLLQLTKVQIDIEHFIYSIRYFLFALIANEILKFASIYIFLIDELASMNGLLPEVSLENTTFYSLSLISDVLFCVVGTISVGYFLKTEYNYSLKIVLLNFLYILLSIGVVYFIYWI